LSLQSYAKPEFLGLQNRPDGLHSEAMIKDCRVLLGNTQDATQCMAIYSDTCEYIKYQSGIKTYISDDQLHPMELCTHQCIQVQVEGLEGEHISHMCRCTGSPSWHRGDPQNTWV
jgi:hypothetical protein